MKLRSIFVLILAGIILTGCAGAGTLNREPLIPTRTDMLSLANEPKPIRPYSRYVYKMIGKDGIKTVEGFIDISPRVPHDLSLVEEGSKLRIHASKTFMDTWDISFGDSDLLPFSGGTFAGGRLEIVPGFSGVAELKPEWFPEYVSLSVDSKCNFLIESRDPRMSDIQKLVAFIDARGTLDRVRCELIGTFHGISELQQLIKNASEHGKYGSGENYVLRLNWTDTFALIRMVRK